MSHFVTFGPKSMSGLSPQKLRIADIARGSERTDYQYRA
jgi:hypothetical protein